MRKAFNFYRSYYEVAKELKDKDRLAFYDALISVQFTGEMPILEGMAKFAFISQQHSIHQQLEGFNNRLKRGDIQVDTIQIKLPTAGGTAGGTAEGKGEEEEEVQSVYNFDFKKSLIGLGVNKQLVTEWMQVRKQKKAVNTETAYKRFITEVNKSGASVSDVVKLCVEKSWSGFEAEWYAKHSPQPKQSQFSEW